MHVDGVVTCVHPDGTYTVSKSGVVVENVQERLMKKCMERRRSPSGSIATMSPSPSVDQVSHSPSRSSLEHPPGAVERGNSKKGLPLRQTPWSLSRKRNRVFPEGLENESVREEGGEFDGRVIPRVSVLIRHRSYHTHHYHHYRHQRVGFRFEPPRSTRRPNLHKHRGFSASY